MVFSCSRITLFNSSNWCSRCARLDSSFRIRSLNSASLMHLLFFAAENHNGPCQREHRDTNARPPEPGSVNRIKGGGTTSAVEQGYTDDPVPHSINIPGASKIHGVQAAKRIGPAGQSVIG